ncbi:MAG: hypothetical protein CUR33_12120 [Pseudomonas sp.]|uniref:hypothetical protein n=1 Tax=Pseudomonas sp. FEMGT703P TaxID=2080764 RepID=UPI000CBDB4EF|nr:hypothetical protein [Pseudomonas sp. FEMGT703P]PJE40888.1 MAG: hypothetical protein CUR33_12120 [Pseudomonas sp.] [Pseudomonas sp. FEMGT703P]
MLLLKLTVVPLFIAALSLAGRRWGSGVAGLLGGFPIVAGPIVVFVALEQGSQFGALTATAAISAIAALLVFGVAYCWASTRWSWPTALAYATGAWFFAAIGLEALPTSPAVAIAVAGLALALAPRALPPSESISTAVGSLTDLPYRMITGAMLTLAVTTAAASLGEVWSGLLAVFPIIGLVLAVFTHRAQGPYQVAHVYHGMVKGLYSFATFFLALAVLWPRIEFWSACAIAVGASIATQAVVQGLLRHNSKTQQHVHRL